MLSSHGPPAALCVSLAGEEGALDVEATLGPHAKALLSVTKLRQLPAAVRDGALRATDGVPGPVVLLLPWCAASRSHQEQRWSRTPVLTMSLRAFTRHRPWQGAERHRG